MNDDELKPKQANGANPGATEKVHQTDEQGDGDPPPPPDISEKDLAMTPEELERARKKYLLRRFWISARGYWSRRGDKIAWPFSIGLLALICINVGFQYGVNVWNRGLFDAISNATLRPFIIWALCSRRLCSAVSAL